MGIGRFDPDSLNQIIFETASGIRQPYRCIRPGPARQPPQAGVSQRAHMSAWQ